MNFIEGVGSRGGGSWGDRHGIRVAGFLFVCPCYQGIGLGCGLLILFIVSCWSRVSRFMYQEDVVHKNLCSMLNNSLGIFSHKAN